MNRFLLTCMLALAMTATACKSTTAASTTLAPGYQNQADQTMGEVLAAANGFYRGFQAKVQAGTYIPSATEKQAWDSFAAALNTADAAYLAFHNGSGTQAAAQTAVTSVQTQQAALQAQMGAK